MIPNANNINNYNNQIKIQLTNDNKCIIQTLTESPIKSQNTILKEDYSINEDMSLSKSNSNINNISQNAAKQKILNSNTKTNNIFNDLDNNSNLLISFSNISEVAKMNNNDVSITRINSNKNNSILMNKERDFITNTNKKTNNINGIINMNNNTNAGYGGNSFLLNQMQILTGDKNVTINNINNYNIANSDGNSIISNNNFFISNDKNNKINNLDIIDNICINDNFNDENTDTIKTPNKTNNKKIDTSNKNKTNSNNSKTSKNSNKCSNSNINKQLLNSFNKNDISGISGIINLNIDDKSENYDKVNMIYSDKKSFNTSNNLNSTTSIKMPSSNISPNKPINKNPNNKNNNKKFFKNCIVQKNEDINIIQINSNTYNNKFIDNKKINSENNNIINNYINDKIVPKHCANFSFSGITQQKNNLKNLAVNNCLNKNINNINLDNNQNTNNINNINNNNLLDKNDDYVSPTFNLNLNFNSLDKNNTIESNKEKDKENSNKSDKIKNNNYINNNVDNNIKIKDKKNNKPPEISNGSTIEVTDKDKNKREIIKKNNDNNPINNANSKNNNKIQEKNLSITINSNIASKTNTNTKPNKVNHLINFNADNINNNNLNVNYNNINANQTKIKKNKTKTTNNKSNITNNVIINNINNLNNNNIQNEKCNHIIVNKKNPNVRYNRHPNGDSINIYNNIKNLFCSMTESDTKNKKLSISHNKSKSGTGSVIKFQVQDSNIFNIKSGNLIKTNNNYNFKKFKSISPTIQRRNGNNMGIKDKNKSKSQSRSKTKSKSHYNKNDINELNNLIINGKYNNNSSKQKSLKEKMDSILSKNIIALTKKIRKSPSPKIRISRPSLIKNIIYNQQGKIIENFKYNNMGNNIYYNGGAHPKKNKNSPSPVSFRISNNNTNNIYNSNTNHKKSVLSNPNNLLLNNNKKVINRKKTGGNSPKYLINQNSTEHYDNSGLRNNEKIYQSSLSNKKKNFSFKNRSNNTNININSNVNNGLIKNQKIVTKKIKNNITNINRKNINMYKYDDDYNSLNERKKSLNVNILKGNKRQNNLKNNFIGNMIYNNKTSIINDICKKNTVIMNNKKINNNTNKKQMTIIQNFSKYRKKRTLNIVNKNYIKNIGHNENISNNYYEDNKIINDTNPKKTKTINIHNIVNKTIDEKRRKNEYNHSQPKIIDNTNNCYTN